MILISQRTQKYKRKTWEHLAAITDRLTSVLFNDDIKSFGGIGEREYATINIPGGDSHTQQTGMLVGNFEFKVPVR